MKKAKILINAFFLLSSFALSAQSTATYRVTFESAWSEVTHPVDVPVDPHWSGVVGMTHNAATPLFESGMIATQGIVNVAQSGNRDVLNDEIEDEIDDGGAQYRINGGGIALSPDVITFEFEVSSSHPYLSLVSMLAPSPDWFVGLKNLNLYENGNWVESSIRQFTIYDAGSDSGTTFTSSNQNTDPREGISLVEDGPLVVNGMINSLGLWRIERVDNESNCDLSGGELSGGPFEFCVDGSADQLSNSDINVSNVSGDNRQWVISSENGTILGLPNSFTDPDFDAAGPGICYIWHLAYEDGIDGLEMGNNLSDLEGCYNLSNSTYVKRTTCGGGEDRFDLGLEIEVDNSLYEQYEHVVYTIQVKNQGTMNATNLTIAAGLPEGMVYSNHEVSEGDYSLYHERWEIDELAPGQSATLTLDLFTLIEGEDITNFVEITSVDQTDIDSSPNNGNGTTPSEDDEAAVVISPSNGGGGFGGEDGEANLSLSIKADKDTYEQYEKINYTITLMNMGPDDATNVEVMAGLPEGMVYSDHHASEGNYSLYFEKWRLDLESDKKAVLELTLFTLIEDTPITNFVEVFAAGQQDPNSTPGNGNGNTPNEDDEASTTINPEVTATYLIFGAGEIPNALPENNAVRNKIALVNLFPVPAKKWIKANVLSSKNEKVHFKIVNTLAQEVMYQEVELQEGINEIEMNISNLPTGNYFLNINAGSSRIINTQFSKISD